jgi:D-alanyl-D-alanine-carboxypeptidase/D-alanyl-D-alanine-endopeptidase
MELLDRYLQAVRFWLPRAQQDDIIAELSEDIRSQVEEQESELGRQLNEAEIESILKQRGRPLLVANRYLPQQHLIGPVLFPVYRFVMKIVILCYLIPWLLVWAGLMIFDPGYRAAHSVGGDLMGAWGSFWLTAFTALGIVTIVFAVLERVQSKSGFLGDWKPRKLPPVRNARQISRSSSVFELAAHLVFMVWWVNHMWFQTLFERSGVRIVLAPTWRAFFWAFLLLALANAVLSAVNLFRPYWTRFRGAVRLALNCAGSVGFCWLLKAHLLAEISAPHLSSARAVEITNAINTNLSRSFPFAVMACVLIIALADVGRLVRLRAGRSRLIQGLAAIVALAAMTTSAGAQTLPANPNPGFSELSDAEIRELLVDHVDVQHKSVGTVVGIISPQGRRIISYGQLNQGDPRPLNGDTVFEIGSITKIFTALLLSDMVRRGEVALTDPVAKYLPAGIKMPERNGRQITLVDLATHTSGLPFLPSNLPGASDPANFSKYMGAISGYSDEQLYQFLSTYQLENDPGSHWAYSNLGVGLLGKALARRAGMDYENLVRARITGPLGMASTAITVSPQMKARFGVGHNTHLQPAPDWVMPVFAGAGSLRSTAYDLLTFLAAFMGYTKSPLLPAMTAMLETRRPGGPNLMQAVGWWVVSMGPGDDGIVAFGGQTLGYASTLAYDPKTRVGVVVLSNGAADDGGLGWHMLRPAFPVATSTAARALKERKEMAVDLKLFDLYAGQYQPAVGGIMTIERQGDALLLKSPSSPQGVRLHAQSERIFFITETDLTITFQVGSTGRATGLIVHFAGADTPVPRINSGSGKN